MPFYKMSPSGWPMGTQWTGDISDDVSMGKGKAARLRCYQSNCTVLFARLAIMTLMAVAICTTTMVTFYWTQFSSLEAVRGLGDSLRYNLLDRSVNLMNATLVDQTAVLAVMKVTVLSQYQSTGSFFGAELDWKTWPLVSNPHHLRNFGIVLETGEYRYTWTENATDGSHTYRSFANATLPWLSPQTSYIEPLDANGNPSAPPHIYNTAIDFRQRKYYLSARHARNNSVFFDLLFSIQSYPVLIAATPVASNATGESLGVITVSTTLDELSLYISSLDLHGGGLYFKTRDNILVAAANSSSDFQSKALGSLKHTNQSDNALIRATEAYICSKWSSESLLSQPTKAADVSLLGELYYVDTLPIKNYNLQVVAVLMIPRQSIMEPIDHRRRQTVLLLACLSSGVFIIGCVLVFCLTTRVSTEVRLKAELGEAKARAEANSEAKSRFLSNMSHELRTPMAGILGLLDIIFTDELSPENLVNISQIRQCATGLLGLLNNLLDLGKIEAGKVDLEWADFDLTAELESLVDMYSVQCNQKGIEIALDLAKNTRRIVRGDQARLRQVFANLLSNAIKFSSEGGHILVKGWPVESPDPSNTPPHSGLLTPNCRPTLFRRIVRRISRRTDCNGTETDSHSPRWVDRLQYAFEVDDTGLGIPPEKRELVFENFVQADSSTTRLHGGTGLGLGIVRSLVGMMGGQIHVKDKAGPGTRMGFTVCFERASDAPGSPHPVSTAARFPEGTRVVLGVPGGLSRQIASRYVRDQDLDVHEAADWAAVLALLRSHTHQHPDRSNGASDRSERSTPHRYEQTQHPDETRVSIHGGMCPAESRPSDSVVVDVDALEDDTWRASRRTPGPPALLVILDITVVPVRNDDRALARCLAELRQLAGDAIVAWLVSSETPASTRQTLKAGSPRGIPLLATKPVYRSRLHSLLEAMSERIETTGYLDNVSRAGADVSIPGGDVSGAGADVSDCGGVSRLEQSYVDQSQPQMICCQIVTENQASANATTDEPATGLLAITGFRESGLVSNLVPSVASDCSRTDREAEDSGIERVRLNPVGSKPTSSQVETETGTGLTPIKAINPSGREAGVSGRPNGAQGAGLPVGGVKKDRRPQKSEVELLGRALAGMKILVAEDTPILQKLTVALLNRLGAEVSSVCDGQQAADMFTRHYARAQNSGTPVESPFTCMLMDCQMPVMDGYDSTRAIRRCEEASGHHTPIIALTAHCMASDRDKCLAAGMDAYLSKPIKPALLVSTLQNVTRQQSITV